MPILLPLDDRVECLDRDDVGVAFSSCPSPAFSCAGQSITPANAWRRPR
jgi:hypothetical protein